jgi:hypothetical protein
MRQRHSSEMLMAGSCGSIAASTACLTAVGRHLCNGIREIRAVLTMRSTVSHGQADDAMVTDRRVRRDVPAYMEGCIVLLVARR